MGIVGYFITFVILTRKAGIDPDLDGIQLSWFDYWKTEIGALVIMAFALFGIVPLRILNGYFSFLTKEGIVGFVALGENFVFLTGWLSLMRRAKAKILWKNSIACALSEMLRDAFANSRRTTKVLTLFLGFLCINYVRK